MSENKTHYRKVLKSDHLGVADLEDFKESGSNLVFTIKQVRQELNAKVAGKKINANIAYFHENIKPLVLNATNAGVMKKLSGSPFIEDWANVAIQLYIDDKVKLMGDVVGGVRISPKAPRMQKAVITPDNKKMWAGAKNAFKRDGNFIKVMEKADISEANMQLIMQECSNV